jgi:hypothetical protein
MAVTTEGGIAVTSNPLLAETHAADVPSRLVARRVESL